MSGASATTTTRAAALTGLSPGTDAAAIYRAILESIAYGFAAVDERLSAVLGGASGRSSPRAAR